MLTWKVKTNDKTVFLTFDDGPHPTITPWVLNQLKLYNAKATFFCVGDNVQRFPKAYQQVMDDGHHTGNHTFNHLNGWKTPASTYMSNVDMAAKVIHSKLFRPPYGRVSWNQLNQLKKRGFTVVMWDVLTCDYEQDLNTDLALSKILNSIKPGSIVVFHDSVKAQYQLEKMLPIVLQQLSQSGYTFKALPV